MTQQKSPVTQEDLVTLRLEMVEAIAEAINNLPKPSPNSSDNAEMHQETADKLELIEERIGQLEAKMAQRPNHGHCGSPTCNRCRNQENRYRQEARQQAFADIEADFPGTLAQYVKKREIVHISR